VFWYGRRALFNFIEKLSRKEENSSYSSVTFFSVDEI